MKWTHLQGGGRQGPLRGVLQGEEDLCERVEAQIAYGVQFFDQLLEGQILVSIGLQGGFPHALQEEEKAGVAREIAAQDQRIDEKADQSFQFWTCAIGDGRGDHDIIEAGGASEQHLEGGQQGHEQGDAFLLAEDMQGRGEFGGKAEGEAGTAKRLDGGARVIGGQRQESRHLGKVGGPVVEVLLEDSSLQVLQLPHGIVGVLDRQRWERRGLAQAKGLVEGEKFVDEDVQGPTVRDDVMHGQEEHVLLWRAAQEGDPQQGSAGEVKEPGGFLLG